jgi:multimeric flavodoxin WrbA
MKIVAITGSYRKNGNTSQIVNLIEDQLHQIAANTREQLEIETIFLGHQDLGFCRGCRVCFNQGENNCPLKDDLLAIKAKLKSADGILLASPVYVDDVSGIMKNWIDRMAHVCHRPEFAGKCAYLIATVADSPTRHTLGTIGLALRTWGIHIVGQSGFKMGALMKSEAVKDKFQNRATEIAQKLFHAIYRQKFRKPTFFSLMMFKIQQGAWKLKANQNSIDFQYWKNQGWFEPQRDFYISHDASFIKVALARLTGAIIARFVT